MNTFDDSSAVYGQRFYRESGIAPPGGVVLTLLMGTVAATVVGAIYSAITFINPFIYINLLATIGLGISVAAAVGMGASWGRVRNNKVVLALALLSAAIAEYVSWVTFVSLLMEGNAIILSPAALLEIIPLIAEEGYYSLGSSVVSGTLLWVLWGIEALMVFGIAAVGTVGVSEVYCEESGEWTEEQKDVVRLRPLNDQFIKKLLDQDYSVLHTDVELEPATSLDALRIDLFQPRIKTADHYLSVVQLSPKETKEGLEAEEQVVLKHLIIPPAAADSIRALGQRAETVRS